MPTVTVLSPADQQQIITMRIRPRLSELELCERVCRYRHEHGGAYPQASIDLRDAIVFTPQMNTALVDSIFDTGIALCRFFLNFAGLTYGRRKGELHDYWRAYVGHDTDITIAHFGLSEYTINDVCSLYTMAPPADVELALRNTAIAASKGIVHFSPVRASSLTAGDQALACRVIIFLITKVIESVDRATP